MWLVLALTAAALVPHRADGSFVFDGDTRSAADSVFDRYACDPTKPEAGPEVAFALELQEPSDIDVVLEGDTTGVDVDAHILASLAESGGEASDCIARADKNATAFHLTPGVYYIVVDTYGSDGLAAGPFRVWVRVYPTGMTTWTEIARGVRWGRSSYDDGEGFSTTHLIDVDRTAGRSIEVVDNGSCKTVASADLPETAVAAMNGGFFNDSCSPVGLLRAAGVTLQPAAGVETVLGVDAQGVPSFSKPAAGALGSAYASAVGGRGFFRLDGADPGFDTDASITSYWQGRHPRSVVASQANGHSLLLAVDGRTDAGAGLAFGGLKTLLSALGASRALNLDGGGSTSLWVRGEPMSGVVNHPSDNGRADHAGARAVRSLVVIKGEPIDRVHFSSLPPWRTLADGEVLAYRPRAFARRPPTIELEPFESATLEGGTLRFAPNVFQNGEQVLVLRACLESCARQEVRVNVALRDGDMDGLPDAWEADHGLDTSSHDAAADPDHDGQTNAEEYVARTEPNAAILPPGPSGAAGPTAAPGDIATDVSNGSGGSSAAPAPGAETVRPAGQGPRAAAGCVASSADLPALALALCVLCLQTYGRSSRRAQRLHERNGNAQ